MTTPAITQDWQFSDRFIPAIKSIVGPYLIGTAPLARDSREATDIIMLNGRDLAIACRIRRTAYSRYSDEFTLRASRPSGTKSELEKIAEGWADLLLYGFDSGDGKTINPWSLIDLRAVRAHMILNPDAIMHGERKNADGVSFRFFKISSFPAKPNILIACSKNIETSGRKIA